MSYITLGNGRPVSITYVQEYIMPKGGGFWGYPPGALNSRYRSRRNEAAWSARYKAAANHIRQLYEQNPHNVEELAAAALQKVLGEQFQPVFSPSEPENSSYCVIANMIRQNHYDVDVDYYYVDTSDAAFCLTDYNDDGATIAGIAWAFDQGWLDKWSTKSDD